MMTQEEYDVLRIQAIKEYVDHEWVSPDVKFTCDDCPARLSCEFAFDCYNTNGDCLAEK